MLPSVRGHRLLGATALAVVAAAGLLVLAGEAEAQGSAVNTANIMVGLDQGGDFRYICSAGACPPICNDNAARVLFHLAGGTGDCNLVQATQWGLSFVDPDHGFRVSSCQDYSSPDGVCAGSIGTATMANVGYLCSGTCPGNADSVTSQTRWTKVGSPASPLVVTHHLAKTTSPNLVTVDVTVRNDHPTGTFTDVHYRRNMVFEERRHPPGAPPPGGSGASQSLGTNTKLWIEGDHAPPDALRCASNVGWAHGAPQTDCYNGVPDYLHSQNYVRCEDDGRLPTHPNPPIAPATAPAGPPTVSPVAGPGFASPLGLVSWAGSPAGYVDCGQGALFEFKLGDIGPGKSVKFRIFLGGILGTSGGPAPVNLARDLLRDHGAEFWAIAEPGTDSNTTWATAMYGIHGLYKPDPAIAWTTFVPTWTVPSFTPGLDVCLGQPAHFTAPMGYSSYPIAASTWTYGDMGIDNFVAPTAPGAPSHTYAAAGSYTVTLTVTDTAGWSESVTRTIVVKSCKVPPIALFDHSGGGDCVDSKVFFDARMSFDPDGGPVSFLWDFGDGSPTETGSTATHQYLTDDELTVVLTVTDDEGATSIATLDWPPPGDPNCLPDLDPLFEAWVSPGEVFTVPLHATDADGPSLSFEGAATLAGSVTGLSVTTSAAGWDAVGDYVFTVPDWPAGRYELPFRASDGRAFDQETLVLRIRGIVEDFDNDGVSDPADNCPSMVNLDQADTDKNGVGDACQGPDGKTIDTDADGVADTADLCPTVPDPDQADVDGDGIGDACERLSLPGDEDADGWLDAVDNCPKRPNVDQKNLDQDLDGDACDPDADGDRVIDAGPNADNCVGLPNGDQLDADLDGKGNACDEATGEPVTLEERRRPAGDLSAASDRSFLLLVGIGPAVLAGLLLLGFWRRRRRDDQRQ